MTAPKPELIGQSYEARAGVIFWVGGTEPRVNLTGRRYRPLHLNITYVQARPAGPWYLSRVKMSGPMLRVDGSDGLRTATESWHPRASYNPAGDQDMPEWVQELAAAHTPPRTDPEPGDPAD